MKKYQDPNWNNRKVNQVERWQDTSNKSGRCQSIDSNCYPSL